MAGIFEYDVLVNKGSLNAGQFARTLSDKAKRVAGRAGVRVGQEHRHHPGAGDHLTGPSYCALGLL
ncbi:MAG: hypothetical protein ACRD1K_15570 [Acidimicrobiales bacterium]